MEKVLNIIVKEGGGSQNNKRLEEVKEFNFAYKVYAKKYKFNLCLQVKKEVK